MKPSTITGGAGSKGHRGPVGDMPPATAPDIDASFEKRLIERVRPIAEHFLASGLHHLFNTGIYDRLVDSPTRTTVPELASALDMNYGRLHGFLLYLANEGIVTVQGDSVALTARAKAYAEFRPWYTLMIGGYSSTLDQLGDALRSGADFCTRNGRNVGLGSCEVSRYDGMPMTRSLLADAGVEPRELLDLGCGNALYLVDFCRTMPDLRAWGADPDRGAFDAAQALISSERMAGRVRLVNASAAEFLADPPAECDPDLIVFGYVLQELLGQQGENAVIDLLRSTVSRFPRVNIIVIEVANEISNPAVMRHGLARNFWNTYYLIHYFTDQRLETRAFWERLFDKAGLAEHGSVTTPINVDSTGLELGYLLRGPAVASAHISASSP